MNPEDLIGRSAPDFALPDQDGMMHGLSDYSGKWLVVYFYPKDDTPGCTKEACSFRDAWNRYTQQEIAVVGISKDTVVSHKKFSEKFTLSFPLLSDPTGDVLLLYGAWGKKKFMGKSYDGILRYSYLIDPTGIIRKVYKEVKPAEHAQEILADVALLKKFSSGA